eukprot:m.252529 g.252529  ORF g.252529 m.252529 type:complete len:328 (+) comp22664_c0_seq6:2168-3151(+)
MRRCMPRTVTWRASAPSGTDPHGQEVSSARRAGPALRPPQRQHCLSSRASSKRACWVVGRKETVLPFVSLFFFFSFCFNCLVCGAILLQKLADKWEKLMDKAEQLGKTMRSQVGEAITRRNECGSELEASFVREVSSAVADTLKDYYDFLQMKRTRNVTITSYLEKFPGLVHFMYIDRSTDMLTAPCLCQTNDVAEEGATGSHRASLSLKERVWEMYEHAQRHLAKGYTTMCAKAGDFIYSYFIWFENSKGEHLELTKDMPQNIDTFGSEYYKALISHFFPQEQEGTVSCFELYTIHLRLLPFEFTIQQCRALVEELRANSGDSKVD